MLFVCFESNIYVYEKHILFPTICLDGKTHEGCYCRRRHRRHRIRSKQFSEWRCEIYYISLSKGNDVGLYIIYMCVFEVTYTFSDYLSRVKLLL